MQYDLSAPSTVHSGSSGAHLSVFWPPLIWSLSGNVADPSENSLSTSLSLNGVQSLRTQGALDSRDMSAMGMDDTFMNIAGDKWLITGKALNISRPAKPTVGPFDNCWAIRYKARNTSQLSPSYEVDVLIEIRFLTLLPPDLVGGKGRVMIEPRAFEDAHRCREWEETFRFYLRSSAGTLASDVLGNPSSLHVQFAQQAKDHAIVVSPSAIMDITAPFEGVIQTMPDRIESLLTFNFSCRDPTALSWRESSTSTEAGVGLSHLCDRTRVKTDQGLILGPWDTPLSWMNHGDKWKISHEAEWHPKAKVIEITFMIKPEDFEDFAPINITAMDSKLRQTLEGMVQNKTKEITYGNGLTVHEWRQLEPQLEIA